MYVLSTKSFVNYYSTNMSKNYITVDILKSILDEKLAPPKSEVVDLRVKLEETNKFIEFTNAKYEEIRSTLSKQNEDQKGIIAENKILKATMKSLEGTVQHMKEALNDMEQYSRRECLEIKGIPMHKDGKENTNEIITKIGALMGVNVDQRDISVSHRLPVSTVYSGKEREPSIIVKFVRRDVKESYYRARKNLKGITTKNLGYQSSNESLTDTNRKLFKDCLKLKKELGYKFIWTKNGRIYLRKDVNSPLVHIKTRDDTTALMSR